jgi:hypothetical protein
MPVANVFSNYFANLAGGINGARLRYVAVPFIICAFTQTTAFAVEGNRALAPVTIVAPLANNATTATATATIPATPVATTVPASASPLQQPHKMRTTITVSEPKFPIGNKFSRTVQTVTGVNFFTQLVAGMIASRVVEKKVGGHVKVKVKVYSLTDLFAGKVKSVSIKGRGCTLKDVPLGTVLLVSNDPIWFDWHRRDGKVTGLSYPFTMRVTGDLGQQEVCKALSTESLANSLRGLKLDVPGLGEQRLQVLQPRVALGDRRIQIDARLITRGASPDTGVDLTISAVPVLDGSKIFLREMRVSSPDIIDPEHFAKFVEDLFNPIVDFGKFDRADHAFRLTSFVVERDRVNASGNLLLVPRSVGSVKNAAAITLPR